MKNTIYKFKKGWMLVVLFSMSYWSSKACSTIPIPTITYTISGTNLLLNMTGTSPYTSCSYYMDVELVCISQSFTGNAPFFYSNGGFIFNSNPQIFPTQTISLSNLCAGGQYQFRVRQSNSGFTFSNWTPTYTFTMPGVPVPTNIQVTATPPNICFPQTSQLTASVTGGCGGGTPSFTWIPSVGLSCTNCANPVANPTVTTTYTVMASGGPGTCWSASAAITISSFTVAPVVGTPSLIPNLCNGQSNQISISYATGALQWDLSFNGAPYAPVPGATGTTMVTSALTPGLYCYQLRATGCGGSVTSSPTCATVYAIPTVAVTSATVCSGQAASFVASGATSYSWQSPVVPINVNTGTVVPPTNGSYMVTGTSNGCSSSAIANVTVYPYPASNPNSNSPVCNGSPINLSTPGIGTYQWVGPNGWTSAVQNPVIPVSSTSMIGIYNLSVTANGCTSTGTLLLNVLNPTVSAANNGPYCSLSNVQLNSYPSGGIVAYYWSGPNFFSSNQPNPVITNAPFAADGIYSLTVSDGTCMSSVATTSVGMYALPTPDPSSNGPICELGSLNLSITPVPGTVYNWTGPNGFSVTANYPVISPAYASLSGAYMVTAIDNYGCSNTATIIAQIKPLPSITVSDNHVCPGRSGSLTATGGVAYNWSGPNNLVSNAQTLMFSPVNPSDVGEYTVVVTGVNSCTVQATAQLSLNPLPSPQALCLTPIICMGGKANFEGHGGLLYNWTGPNNFVSHDSTASIASVNSMAATGFYTLGVINEKGCSAYAQVYMEVKPLPTATISASDNKKCVPFCANYALDTGSQLTSIQWSMNNSGTINGNNYSDCFKTDGSRVLRAIYADGFGCTNMSTYNVEVYPIPVADFHFGPGDAVEGDQVEFTDASRGVYVNQWTWLFEKNGVKPSYSQNPGYVFEKAGSWPVTLIISNKFGCKDTITKAIRIGESSAVWVPDVFSPNGDGVNDTFFAKGVGITNFKMEIFDRWGERIFVSTDITNAWDGTIKGKTAKDEMYIWQISVTDNQTKTKEYTGHVSIMK